MEGKRLVSATDKFFIKIGGEGRGWVGGRDGYLCYDFE
jgi:hypothetical protein